MINRTVTILLESATSSEKERAKQIPINVTKISNLPTFVMPIRGLSHSSKRRNTHACIKNLFVSHLYFVCNVIICSPQKHVCIPVFINRVYKYLSFLEFLLY